MFAPIMSVQQLESSASIFNPAEQLAYYYLRADSDKEQAFADSQILKIKRDFFADCIHRGISVSEAWKEVEFDAQLLVHKLMNITNVELAEAV